jgi:hypothetical protein
MGARIKNLLLAVAGSATLTFLWHLLGVALPALAEHAVMGWIDDKIGEGFGLTSPSVSAVTSWLIPFAFFFVCFYLYHFLYSRFLAPRVPALTAVTRSDLIQPDTPSPHKAGPPPTRPKSNAIDGWQKLYEEYEERGKKELRLRFLPDTGDNKINDALWLICYGYKALLNRETVPVALVHSQLTSLRWNDPTVNDFFALMARHVSASKSIDYGSSAVGLFVQRIGLLEGGKYRITELGENHAKELAEDLIRRA